MSGIAGRHPAVTDLLEWFDHEHLAPGLPKEVSKLVGRAAFDVTAVLGDSAELSAGLRHLLEAKDCFVRAGVKQARTEARS